MFNHQRLRCFSATIEIAKKVPALTNSWPKGNSYLEDQLKRALSSIALNIAEGNGRSFPRERRRFFDIARASTSEVSAIIEFAHAIGLVKSSEYDYFQDILLQIYKMLCKLR